MSQAELERFFKFDQSDLIANQNGKFSAKQEKRLQDIEKSTSKTFRYIGFALILVNICIVSGIANSMISEGFSFSTATGREIFEFVLPLLFVTGILGFFAWAMFWIASSKVDYSLKKIQGEINFVKVEKQQSYKTASGSTSYRTVQQYELRVGKTKFEDVDEGLLNIIKEGDTYIFYYIKGTKEILSCEFISKGK